MHYEFHCQLSIPAPKNTKLNTQCKSQVTPEAVESRNSILHAAMQPQPLISQFSVGRVGIIDLVNHESFVQLVCLVSTDSRVATSS